MQNILQHILSTHISKTLCASWDSSNQFCDEKSFRRSITWSTLKLFNKSAKDGTSWISNYHGSLRKPEVWSYSFALAFASATEKGNRGLKVVLWESPVSTTASMFQPLEHKPAFSDPCVICQLNLLLWFLQLSLSSELVSCTSVQNNISCPTQGQCWSNFSYLRRNHIS